MSGILSFSNRRWIAAFLAVVYVGATLVYGAITVEAAAAESAPVTAADNCACCSGGGCSDTCCCGGDETPPTEGLVLSGSCDVSAPVAPVELRRWALPDHLQVADAAPLASDAVCIHTASISRRLVGIDLAPPTKIPIAA